MSATPQSFANAAFGRSRSGLSPPVTNRAAVMSGPMATTARVAGAVDWRSCSIWRSRTLTLPRRCWARMAMLRRAAFAA